MMVAGAMLPGHPHPRLRPMVHPGSLSLLVILKRTNFPHQFPSDKLSIPTHKKLFDQTGEERETFKIK